MLNFLKSKKSSDLIEHWYDESFPYRPSPPVPQEYIDTVHAHIAHTVGKPETTLSALHSPYEHVDLLLVPPGFKRRWITLITCGMGNREMAVPPELAQYARMELAICLPQDWLPFVIDGSQPGPGAWIIPMLHYFARVPFEYATWLDEGHLLPNGDPPQSLAEESQLCTAMVTKPRRIRNPEFHTMKLGDKVVFFWSLTFITGIEYAFLAKNGIKAFMDKLRMAKVDEMLQLDRPSVCKKGIFGIS